MPVAPVPARIIRTNIIMWYVYILECSDQTFYTGITTDLKRRTKQHNASVQGAKYTRSRRPVKLVYSCELPTKSEAQKEEYRIRKLSKNKKEELLKRSFMNSIEE